MDEFLVDAPLGPPAAVVGYLDVVDSSNHLLVAKGGPEVGQRWRYRVVCLDGAFVRDGMELTSPYLYNLPFQSVVEVSQESGVGRAW